MPSKGGFFMASHSLKIKEGLKSPRCPWQKKKQNIFACRSASGPSGRNDKWRFLTTGLWFILTFKDIANGKKWAWAQSGLVTYNAVREPDPRKAAMYLMVNCRSAEELKGKNHVKTCCEKGDLRLGADLWGGDCWLSANIYWNPYVFPVRPSFSAPVVWRKCVRACVTMRASGVECQSVEYQHHVIETRWEGSSSDIRGLDDECALLTQRAPLKTIAVKIPPTVLAFGARTSAHRWLHLLIKSRTWKNYERDQI